MYSTRIKPKVDRYITHLLVSRLCGFKVKQVYTNIFINPISIQSVRIWMFLTSSVSVLFDTTNVSMRNVEEHISYTYENIQLNLKMMHSVSNVCLNVGICHTYSGCQKSPFEAINCCFFSLSSFCSHYSAFIHKACPAQARWDLSIYSKQRIHCQITRMPKVGIFSQYS